MKWKLDTMKVEFEKNEELSTCIHTIQNMLTVYKMAI